MKNILSSLLLTVGLAVALPACSSVPPKVAGMSPVDFLNISALSGPAISPGGDRIVYSRKESDWVKNKQVGNLWLVDIHSGDNRQLTFNASREQLVSWSPDGNTIAFVAKREEDSYRRIYLLPTTGGEPFAISDHRADVRKYHWSSDGKMLYFLADDPVSETTETKKASKDDMVAFESPEGYRHIWRIDIGNRETTKITEGDYFVTNFDLSSDDRFIAYSRGDDPTLDGKHSANIWWMSVADGKARRLTSNHFSEDRIEISPDGKQILFVSDINEKGEYYYDANLFVVTVASGEIQPLVLDRDFEVEDAHWAANSKQIYIRANMGVRSELWRIGVTGSAAVQLTKGDHSVQHWQYSPLPDRHTFVLTTAHNPGEINHMLGSGGDIRAATRIFADLSKRYRLPQQKVVRWKAEDGTELEGLLTLPLDYRKGKRYPLITHVHGGPRSSDQFGQFRWRTYIPVLAAQGYAYFTPNHRGSRGYGDDFLRDMVGNYFRHAHTDVLAGVDHLIEVGVADPEQLAIAGWSAGGHMVNKLITVTDRFKAASSGAGAVDWTSMYGESDVRYGRTPWFGGSPWQRNAPLDAYRQQSPLKDLWKAKTPTIIFVGEKDVRVPPAQSKILYRGLRDLGVETELYIAPREPHGFKELRHRLFKINAELDWFERHIKEAEYQWQPVPK